MPRRLDRDRLLVWHGQAQAQAQAEADAVVEEDDGESIHPQIADEGRSPTHVSNNDSDDELPQMDDVEVSEAAAASSPPPQIPSSYAPLIAEDVEMTDAEQGADSPSPVIILQEPMFEDLEEGLLEELVDIDEDEEVPSDEERVPISMLDADLSSDDDDDDEVDEVEISPSIHSSPPLPQQSSPIPASEPPESPSSTPPQSIEQPLIREPLSPLHIALGLMFERSGASREDYVRFREVINLAQLVTDAGTPLELPGKLDTLKRRVRGHLPMLRLLRKAVPVLIEKQTSLPEREKRVIQIRRKTWLYWYDPIDLIRTILSATSLTEKMHFGLAHFVDDPTEFWHSKSWASSCLSTSGEHAYTRRGEMIIPGDIVRFDKLGGHSKGRVESVGRDFESNARHIGEVVLLVALVVNFSSLPHEVQDRLGQADSKELFLLDGELMKIPSTLVSDRLDILLKWEYDDEHDEIADVEDRFFIKRFFTTNYKRCQPVRLLQPMRGELEVACFGREQLQEFHTSAELKVRSLPIIFFIDDFGLHRNMYRAIKAFYWIPANLPFAERCKIANVFTLTLGPHGADIKDIVKALKRSIRQLGAGIVMHINGEDILVRAFPIVLIGDMPQQADNSGFLRHAARYGCRACFCPEDKRGDMGFDIYSEQRSHFDTVFDRQYAQTELSGQEQKKFLTRRGMRLEDPPIAELAPTLDLILSRGYDAPHSEWRGIGRPMQNLLFTAILTKVGVSAYLKAFQSFPFPPGWPRIQSPVMYMWSWSLSEAGRASILTPLILRSCSRPGWFRMRFLQAAEQVINVNNDYSSSIEAIISAYRNFAEFNSIVGANQHTPAEIVHSKSKSVRRSYIALLQCAQLADRTAATPAVAESDDTSSQDEQIAGMLEEDDLVQAAPGATGRPARSKYDKLMGRPNVHVGLHLADNVLEYATVSNCNVLAGELKHKYYKSLADTAAPPSLMAYIFAKDVVQQSMRLGLAGAWHQYHELEAPLAQLRQHCPRLMNSFLPTTEHDKGEVNDEDALDAVLVREDDAHVAARLSVKGFVLNTGGNTNPLGLRANIILARVEPTRSIANEVRQALRLDYGITNVVTLSSKPLRWSQRLAYSDPVTNKRWVYNIGDYLTVRQTEARLEQCFTMRFRDHPKPYVFLIVRHVHQLDMDGQVMIDDVLGLPVYRLSSQQAVYGLPALANRLLYFVQAPTDGPWTAEVGGSDASTTGDDVEQAFLLKCEWDIAHM